MTTENKNFYLLKNLSGRHPVGLVGARETTESDIRNIAERTFGSTVEYFQVSESLYREGQAELRERNRNPLASKIRNGARALYLAHLPRHDPLVN